MPSLESIGLAATAAGGPKAALRGLASIFTTTLPAAIGVIVPFFTVTIPAAFSAILPFLGPVGLIAAGVAAVVLAWRNWDQIVTFAKNVYTGVKDWMVDKFGAV